LTKIVYHGGYHKNLLTMVAYVANIHNTKSDIHMLIGDVFEEYPVAVETWVAYGIMLLIYIVTRFL